MNLASTRLYANAVVEALRAAGLAVGDGEAKHQVGGVLVAVTVPYVVVYPTGGGQLSGTIEAPDDDATMVFQTTCVGESREQADGIRDACRAALLDQTVTVAGRRTMRVNLDLDIGVRRDDATGAPALFYGIDRYRLFDTPA